MSKLSTIYIISKGRPQCVTAQTLISMGYNGDWFIVCGNNDETIPQYIEKWGKDKIIVFDWYEKVKNSNLLDNFGYTNISSGAVPVRNVVREISFARGELRHWQFDDDYTCFRHIDKELKKNVKMSGEFFKTELERLANFAYKANLTNIGFSLANEAFPVLFKHFSCRVFNAHNLSSEQQKFITWRGRMNDDLINAIDTWRSGGYEMSLLFMNLNLQPTQSSTGGNTDIYQLSGTVMKTAYAVMVEPKNCKLVFKFGRYHHRVNWEKVKPKLLNEKYRK